jgi:hypothetical protein
LVGANVHPEEGLEETVAETMTADGTIVGRWVVKWGADGAGACHQTGHIVRWVKFFMKMVVDVNVCIPLDTSMSTKSCYNSNYESLSLGLTRGSVDPCKSKFCLLICDFQLGMLQALVCRRILVPRLINSRNKLTVTII